MHLVTLLSVVITLCLMQLVVGARLKMPPALKECIYANIPEEKILVCVSIVTHQMLLFQDCLG